MTKTGHSEMAALGLHATSLRARTSTAAGCARTPASDCGRGGSAAVASSRLTLRFSARPGACRLANAPLVQTGTDGADTLEGGEGWANIIYGYAGDDNLIGGDGSYNPRGFDDTHNYIFGGAGNDDIVGGDGGAFGIVQGGDVYNFLHGGAGDDTLSGGDSFPLEAYGTNAYNYVYGARRRSAPLSHRGARLTRRVASPACTPVCLCRRPG